MYIDPIEWVKTAQRRSPSPGFMTDWYDGNTSPAREGYYERHFTDSPIIGFASIQYWDGSSWLVKKGGLRHWRQVGDYPAWRGLTHDQHKLQWSNHA